MENVRIVLRQRPTDIVEERCFEIVRNEAREPDAGEILVRTCWLAFAPAQRGILNDIPSYVPPVAIGEVMRATAVGQVVFSNNDNYAEGDLVVGSLGWQSYCTADPSDPALDLEKLPSDVTDPKLALNVLGTTGMTAYVGMHDIGRPVDGDTVLVTAAAGSVGSLAGQIARIMGAARIIGTAGSAEKRAWVREIAGFDDCIAYRDDHVFRLLRRAAPDGYNVVFDNVGGALLDDALGNIARGGRVVLCGSISTGYRPERPEIGLRNYQLLTTRRARMEGFIVLDHRDRYPAARADMLRWLDSGALNAAEDIVQGLEHAPATLRRLFEGKNLGKQLLRVADPVARPADS